MTLLQILIFFLTDPWIMPHDFLRHIYDGKRCVAGRNCFVCAAELSSSGFYQVSVSDGQHGGVVVSTVTSQQGGFDSPGWSGVLLCGVCRPALCRFSLRVLQLSPCIQSQER